MKKRIYILWCFLCSITFQLNAQCAMCRAVLESQSNTAQAEGVNNGIIFLMAVPYVLVGIIVFFIYKTFSKKN